MRQSILVGSLFTVVAVACLLIVVVGSFLKPATSQAEPVKTTPVAALAARASAPQLPVSRVVLFSSGVGYFQREGEIDGSARVDLSFPVQDINDLLKSMVLQDLGGGLVSAVSYDSHDPIDKTLQSFAVNLTTNPSYGQILNQARGEKVEVVLQQSNTTQPGTLTGTVIGVERQRQSAGKDTVVEVETLNLWCAEGMRAVKLADVQRVRFLNPVMDSEVRRALEVLALSHDTQKKAVSLNFSGEGKRPVRVSYVVENPIWKTSYRLVLGKNGKPFLQGWAVVENPSDEDWNNVRMALVSGRPISFQMDLYQPLYVPRPMVEPELFASLRPQTYSGNMQPSTPLSAGPPPAPQLPSVKAETLAEPELRKAGEKQAQDKQGGAGSRHADILGALRIDKDVDLRQGVASAASAAQLGDFFQYTIEHPVNLPRQKSAMLPIVNKDVEGSRVSIYNERTLAKHPLLGLKFKNTTGLHLMQGPITVFEGSSYAGDARVLDVQPNEERLLSYAIDLGTEVDPVAKRDADRLTAVKINKGILHSTTKIRESKTYTIKNRSEQERTLLIEHPFRADFKLVSADKPAETARDVYRFELKVPAGKTASQTVTEERDLASRVTLTNSDDQSIRIFLNSNVTSSAVKDALKQAMELKQKLTTTQRDMAQVDRQLKVITDDQTRLRANLQATPQTSATYKRYLEKLDTQETDIEKLQAQVKKLQDAEHQQRTDYESYLANLNVE